MCPSLDLFYLLHHSKITKKFQGGFSECLSVMEAGEQYRKQCDSTYEFINERLEPSTESNLGKAEVYKAYTEWCQESGIRFPASQTAFNKRLKEAWGVTEGIDRSIPGKAPRVWRGLKRKEQDEM